MNKGTVRVLEILTLFAARPCWGVSEVAREKGCGKTTAFQALDTLAQEGWLVRAADGARYQLGPQALTLLPAAGAPPDLRALCRPYLERLQRLTGESLFLSIIVGRDHVCIDSIAGPGQAVGYTPLSRPLPLHAGAGSRLLLACLEDDEIARWLAQAAPLERFTPTTITDEAALWEEIRGIRERGWSRGYEDFSTGFTYLSFPVRSAIGRPLGAITIGGPKARFEMERAEAMAPAIRAVLDELDREARVFPALPQVLF